ncbi:MAG: hypothetical protein GY861_11565 [bacterium]|nr:hypothetical protein [bacterium]
MNTIQHIEDNKFQKLIYCKLQFVRTIAQFPHLKLELREADQNLSAKSRRGHGSDGCYSALGQAKLTSQTEQNRQVITAIITALVAEKSSAYDNKGNY